MSLFYGVIAICCLMLMFIIILYSCEFRFKSKVVNYVMDTIRLVFILLDGLLVVNVIEHLQF